MITIKTNHILRINQIVELWFCKQRKTPCSGKYQCHKNKRKLLWIRRRSDVDAMFFVSFVVFFYYSIFLVQKLPGMDMRFSYLVVFSFCCSLSNHTRSFICLYAQVADDENRHHHTIYAFCHHSAVQFSSKRKLRRKRKRRKSRKRGSLFLCIFIHTHTFSEPPRIVIAEQEKGKK